MPSRNEQIAISDRLDELTAKTKEGISYLEKQINKLIDLRTRLISDVVTGQVDVRDIGVPKYETFKDTVEMQTEEQEEEMESEL